MKPNLDNLSKCHDARNLAEYEGHTDVDLRLLDDLLKIAGELQSLVLALGYCSGSARCGYTERA
jgi:hypothetical protein